MSGTVLFARSRAGWWLLPLAVLAFSLARWLPIDLVLSPLSQMTRFSPMLAGSALPGALAHLALRRPGGDVELPSAFLMRTRALWWALVAAVLIVPGVVGAPTPSDLPGMLARNILLLMGLGYWTARAVGYDFAWVGGVALVGVTSLFGTTDVDGSPQWWAVLLHSPSAVVPWVCAVCLAGSAWVAYAWRDIQPPWLHVTR